MSSYDFATTYIAELTREQGTSLDEARRGESFSRPDGASPGQAQSSARGLVVDRRGFEARVEGRSIRLTVKEFSLLAFLDEHRGEVLTREQLIERIWGSTYQGSPRTVDVHVRRLRAKLGAYFPLVTLRGVGYKLRREE